MLTLLGSLLGFGSSLLPKVFEFFQERADRAHELAIIDRQMEQMKLGSALKLEEINAKADIAETKRYTSMMLVLNQRHGLIIYVVPSDLS